MKFPFDCLDEARRPRWERLQPPLSTVDDFLLRDAFVLARQLGSSVEDVAAVKRSVLERSLLAKRKRHEAPAAAPLPKQQRLLDAFDSPFPPPSSSAPPAPLTTGFEALDGLFHGGVPRAQVTCLAGDTASGRTQLCLHTALSAAYHQSARVLYIDTNLQVTARRLHSMLSGIVLQHSPLSQSQQLPAARDRLSDEMTATLTRVDIRRCHGLFQGLDVLAEVAQAQRQPSAARYDLVVVDSLGHWFAPLLGDAAERFAPTGGTITTTASSGGRPSLSASAAAAVAVNAHPLVAKATLLLRAIAAGGGTPAVLVTTLASWVLPPSPLAEQQTAAHRGGSLLAHHRHFAAYWGDAFDALLLCANRSLPAALPPVALDPAQQWKAPPTTVTVAVAHRPPYFKQRPASARCVFSAPRP